MGCRCKGIIGLFDSTCLVALPISRGTWSCLHLYMPPANGMAQLLRMCSAVPRSWHHTHLSSSERFHSLRFVGHGNTLHVDWMRNFTIRGFMDHSSLHDSDLASMVFPSCPCSLLHKTSCFGLAGLFLASSDLICYQLSLFTARSSIEIGVFLHT